LFVPTSSTTGKQYCGAGGIERQLPDRDAHAAGAEIAEAEDALAIGDDDKAHILFRPMAEQFAQPAARGHRQIHAAGLAVDMREFLAGLADRRRIDERQIGRRIGHQHGIEQRLVARLQIGQHEIFQEIVIEIGDLGMAPCDLQLDLRDGRRQQPSSP
jgi:hypothetical protein